MSRCVRKCNRIDVRSLSATKIVFYSEQCSFKMVVVM